MGVFREMVPFLRYGGGAGAEPKSLGFSGDSINPPVSQTRRLRLRKGTDSPKGLVPFQGRPCPLVDRLRPLVDRPLVWQHLAGV